MITYRVSNDIFIETELDKARVDELKGELVAQGLGDEKGEVWAYDLFSFVVQEDVSAELLDYEASVMDRGEEVEGNFTCQICGHRAYGEHIYGEDILEHVESELDDDHEPEPPDNSGEEVE